MAIKIEGRHIVCGVGQSQSTCGNEDFVVTQRPGEIKKKTVVNDPGSDGGKKEGGHGTDGDRPTTNESGTNHLLRSFNFFIPNMDFLNVS